MGAAGGVWYDGVQREGRPHARTRILLIAAIALLGLVVLVGGWLGGLYLMVDRPPPGLNRAGMAHGAGGAAGLALLAWALARARPDAHATRMGAGSFGVFAASLIAGAFLVGLTILVLHLRRRPIPDSVVAAHGLLAIGGYTLLVTYLTMLH